MSKIVLMKRGADLSKGGDNMTMWKLRSCPKCGGDMFIDKDIYGWYEKCLQCSYQRDLKDLAEFKKQEARREMEPAKAAGARPNK